MSRDRALSLIGATSSADAAERKATFRAAIKAARPEAHGGDDARFRQVIAAWAVLAREPDPTPWSAPQATPPRIVAITPIQALTGATLDVVHDGVVCVLSLPIGARTGDSLPAGTAGEPVSIIIRSTDGLSVIGDDLLMEWRVSPRVLEDGGRIEVETWAGLHSVWLTPGHPTRRVRIAGLGLPARADRPQGHLFVTLIEDRLAPSPAERMLDSFSRNWTKASAAA